MDKYKLMLIKDELDNKYDEAKNPIPEIKDKMASMAIAKYLSETKVSPSMCKIVGVNTEKEMEDFFETLTQSQKDSFKYLKAFKELIDESQKNVYNQIELEWRLPENWHALSYVMIFKRD